MAPEEAGFIELLAMDQALTQPAERDERLASYLFQIPGNEVHERDRSSRW